MEAYVILTYDLGISGDYKGLFKFMDSHEAIETAGNTGVFKFQYKANLKEELKSEIEKYVKINEGDRIYCFSKPVNENNFFGFFVAGGRVTPPWKGFSQERVEQDQFV